MIKTLVCGDVSWYGVGSLYRIRGIMKATNYHSILVREMVHSAKSFFG